jgi:transposase
MRKIKEVLRLHQEIGLSERQIAKSCDLSRSTVKDYLHRAQRAGLSWPLPSDLDDAQLENLLFPSAQPISTENRGMPPMDSLYQELKKKGVTLQLLWCEYKKGNPQGYQYSQFCKRYQSWVDKLDICLRQEHRAGEKLFVDYAGPTIPVKNSLTGQTQEAYLFVAALGASHYTFVEASFSQNLPSWISFHVHAFEFFGGVPQILVPDNTKTAVTHSCRYEPDLNPTYRDLAEHYGTVVIPARVAKPKDKAKVESAVLLVERWILAALRNHTFFSLSEINQAISQKLQELNNRPLQKLPTTRKALFETLDKPALKPLPEKPYEYAEWKKARVNIDYHIEVDHHYYSVPYQLIKQQVDVRLTQTTLEILFKNQRVASHARSYQKGTFTTLNEHLSKSHQAYLEWTPSRMIRWAAKHGPHTEQLITHILETRLHPHHGFRSCLGILRLTKSFSPERLEAACALALQIKGYSYKSVESILKTGLDRNNLLPEQTKQPIQPILHPNLRGKDYYSNLDSHGG